MKKHFVHAIVSLALLLSTVSVFAAPAFDAPESSAETTELIENAEFSAVSNGWDFETGTTEGWYGAGSTFVLSNVGGALHLAYNGTTSGNSYLGHGNVSFDTADCRYLVFRVRNATTVSRIRFYYRTDCTSYTYNDSPINGSAASETQAVNIPIASNSDRFVTYVYDMTQCPGWIISDGAGGTVTHHYVGCMFAPQSTPSSGTLDIEYVKFTDSLDELIESGELGERTQGWDFENGSAGITCFGSHALGTVADGKLPFTYTPGSDGALYVTAQQQNLAELTKYILIHTDKEVNFKIYYQSDVYGGLSETRTRTTSRLFRGTDGYWMMADFTGAPQYEGILGRYMFASQTGGSFNIDDIVLTNDYVAYFDNGTYEAHLDLASQSGSTLSYNADTGVLTAAAKDYYGFTGINGTGLPADLFRYVVFVPAEGSSVNSGGVYYKNTANTAHSEDQHVFCVKDADGNAYVRFTDPERYGTAHKHPENWAGKTNAWMIQVYGDIADIYFTNRYANDANPPVEPVVFDKFGIELSASSITTDGGTVTATAFARTTDGEVVSADKVRWATDSVCAAASVNNGVLTLTGKMNGTVNITASFTMNGSSYTETATVTVSGQSEKITANTVKYMSFGNSIMSHGTVASYGWYSPDGHGMAASSLDKDYVHRFIHYLEEKYGEGSVIHQYGASVASFERSVAANDVNYDYSSLVAPFASKVAEFAPDIITIQIGENVNTNPTAASYSHALQSLINALKTAAPNASIVLATSFWGGGEKVNGAIAAGEACHVPVAPVHTLTATTEARNANEAIGEYPYSGVATHPGDTGMDNIAKLLYEQANYVLTENYAEQYSLAPTAISFTSSTTSLTSAGSIFTFTASVAPAEAKQDVVFTVDNPNIASVSANGVLTAINDGTVTLTVSSRYKPEVSTSVSVVISGQTPCYTVSFDANTTDTVTNMPSENPWAKSAYTLPTDKYPLRDAYNFVGWSRTPSGDVLTSDTITDDTTYYAIWTRAYEWSFDRAGDTMGFEAVNGFNPLVANGVFRAIATGTYGASESETLSFKSPTLSLPASTCTALNITMTNETFVADTTEATQYGATPTKVCLTVTTTNGTETYNKPVTSSSRTVYTFDLTGLTGTITGFSFRPTNIDSTIEVDHIAFTRTGFALTYDANTSDTVSNMPAPASANGETTLSAMIPVRAGYEFMGWALSDNASAEECVTKVYMDEDKTVYAVWAATPVSKPDQVMFTQRLVGGAQTDGIRFTASVTDEQYGMADEFGFIVTRARILSKLGIEDYHGFTENIAFPGSSVAAYVSGVAYGEVNGEKVEKITVQDNGDVWFSGFMYGVPEKQQGETMVARPYLKYTVGSRNVCLYGEPIAASYLQLTGGEPNVNIDELFN